MHMAGRNLLCFHFCTEEDTLRDESCILVCLKIVSSCQSCRVMSTFASNVFCRTSVMWLESKETDFLHFSFSRLYGVSHS